MALSASKVDVWAADIPNRSGTLAHLLNGLSDAGAKLEFMIARKKDARTSRVFLAPIKGPKQQRAAKDVGLAKAKGMFSLRVEGLDRAGLGADLTEAIAAKGINLRGASAAGVGKKAVFYFAVDNAKNLSGAIQAVRKL